MARTLRFLLVLVGDSRTALRERRALWFVVVTALASAGSVLPALAQEPTMVSSDRIMAAAVSWKDNQFISGLFLTEPDTGKILYRASSPKEPDQISFDDFRSMYRFPGMMGIAFADPLLYLYDSGSRKIWSLDLWGNKTPEGRKTKEKSWPHSRLETHPTHLAVSPHGLVAVMDQDHVVFLQEDRRPVRYERSRFPDPIDMTFSAWHSLHVLDRTRKALVSITVAPLKGEGIVFEGESELPVPGRQGAGWLAMGMFEGMLYVADESAIYAYLEGDRRLVPVGLHHEGHGAVSQLAVTRENLYVLEESHIDRHPRAQPVDLDLDGGPEASQLALMALYRYLDENDLLFNRTVLVRRTREQLQDFLVKEGVLLNRMERGSERKGVWPFRRKAQYEELLEREEFISLFCRLNPTFCEDSEHATGEHPSLRMAVAQGTELVIPNVNVASRLSRGRVDLKGRPVRWHVDQRVVSPEFREKVDNELLLRLNPQWSKQELSDVRNGWATVPEEKWTVTVAVPSADFANESSDLWLLAQRYESATLYGREVYTEQTGRSLMPQPEITPEPDLCQTLKAYHRDWLSAIDYPIDPTSNRLLYPALHQKRVQVGILEFSTATKTRHDAYCADQDHPTWYQAVDLDLVADPDPATFQDVIQMPTDISTFSRDAHHGTHVAAMIAGRTSRCWSGLLPKARLVLVDLTDSGGVRRSIVNASDAETKVFNVSQEFPDRQTDLHNTITDYRDRALFVAAAGNSGKSLNSLDAADVPAPARWGQARNVVTVSACDWGGDILTQTSTPSGMQSGVNHGKRYVDLLAPGKDVYSATEPPGGYGAATGTSQAAPQVAAAAAMLMDFLGARMLPGDVKARLIATADWKPGYQGKVWGGRLNFGRAVRYPERTLIRTTTGSDLGGRLYSMVADNDPRIRIINAPNYYERQGDAEIAKERIRFRHILSLNKQSDGTFRVVLRERGTDRLKILLNARLESSARIQCERFEVFDENDLSFEPDRQCESGLSITQIEEYTLGGHYNIRWGD